MNVVRIAFSLLAAYMFCFTANISVYAEEPAVSGIDSEPLDAAVSDTDAESPLQLEDSLIEEEQTEAAAPDVFVLDEPIDVVVVDVIDDSPVYTVWDKPFNEYQPVEAFTFLLVVFAMLSGMVKFISWAWL